MIYIICLLEIENDTVTKYRILDTCSNSTMIVKPNALKELISSDEIQVVNASIKNNNIVLKDWAKRLDMFEDTSYGRTKSGVKYIITASRENNTYEKTDMEGNLSVISKDTLEYVAKAGAVANCTGDTELIDVYEINEDKDFEIHISKKYNTFIAKTLLLGLGEMSFEYEIENHKVKIREYTGKSKDVILPSFITSIMTHAFSEVNIKTIKLNDGLKVIGARAFAKNRAGALERIEIPETVALVGTEAFVGNPRVVRWDGILNKDRVQKLNNKTIIL